MKRIISIFLISLSVSVSAQYNPAAHVVVNDAMGYAQRTPADGRTMYWDATNFVWRDFQNVSEVYSTLLTGVYRFGHSFISVHNGGTLNGNGTFSGGTSDLYWFRNGQNNADLVKVYLDSVIVPKAVVYVRRLTDSTFFAVRSDSTRDTVLIRGTAAGGITSLVLNTPSVLFGTPINFSNVGGAWSGSQILVNQNPNYFFSGPSAGGPGAPLWRALVAADLPTGIPNANLQNSSISFSTGTSGTDINWSASTTSLGGTATINIPNASGSARGLLTSFNWGQFNNKVDSTSLSNDTVYDWRNGAKTFRYVVTGGGGSGITQLTGDGAAGPGSGSQAFTLTTVNANVGTFGSASAVPVFVVNGKGLITGVTNTPIQIAESQVINLVTDLAGKQATLSGTGYLKFSGTTPSYLTPTQVTADLNLFSSSLQGLVPLSGGGTTNFLRADGTWAAPPGGGGSGTVTTFSAGTLPPLFTTSVATATTTPSLTFTLSNAAANTAFGNFTGSSAAPGFGKVPVAAFATGTANSLIGYDGSGNPSGISVSTGLSLSGGVLTATGGGGGSDSGIVAGFGISVDRIAANRRIVKADTSNTANGLSSVYIPKINSDIGRLSVIKQNYAAQGLSATGTTVTNYPIASLDSNNFSFTTTNYFTAGTKYGGVLWNLPVGDSMLVTAPFGVCIGSSYSEGHQSLGSRLQGNLGGAGFTGFIWNYPDSLGQLSYRFRALTNFRWYNHGIGGFTSSQARMNWPRDVLAQTGNTDGRTTATLSGRKPYIVFYDGCGNDPYFAGMTPQVSINNLKYFAASCQQYGIRLIVCNSPAGGGATAAGYTYLETVNKFLESGGLDQYGAVVYNLKRFFSDPAWGYDGVHMNPAYNGGDGVHFSKNGYDSLAVNVFNACHFPVLTKAIISNNIAPTSAIPNFNYVSALTIDGYAYTTSKPTDTIDITHPFGTNPGLAYDQGDSIWIKATATTNVVGTSTVYGYGNIKWVLDNNPNNDSFYTRKTMGSNGAVSPNLDVNQIRLTQENVTSLTNPMIDAFGSGASGSNRALQLFPNVQGGGNLIVNGLANTTPYQTAALSSYVSTSANRGIGTNGTIYVAGTDNIIGNLQMGIAAAPSAFGSGIGVYGGSLNFETQSSTLSTSDIFKFKCWATLTPSISSPNLLLGTLRTNTGWGLNTSAGADTLGSFVSTFPINNNRVNITAKSFYGGIYLRGDPQSLGFAQLYGFWNANGHNWFNASGESGGVSVIGGNTPAGSARLDVTSSTRGFMPPRMTTGQRDSIGYISSITITNPGSYTVCPTATITGGAGAGSTVNVTLSGTSLNMSVIEGGYGYKTSIPVTVNIIGGTGSGGAATANIHGPDSGLVVFNKTVDSLQYWNGTSWLNMGGSAGGGGAVSSVSNSDGTLTISPTTGAVVASLALSHPNIWTGVQTQPAPIFTGMASSGANDSVLTVDPATGQVHRRSGSFALNVGNGLTNPTPDSIIWGGALNRTTTISGADTYGVLFSGSKVTFGAATTANASMRITASSAVDPTSPVSGDTWFNGMNLFFKPASLNSVDLLRAPTESSATTLTLSSSSSRIAYVNATLAATWTLPATSNNGYVVFNIKNRGANTLTINPNGSDVMYTNDVNNVSSFALVTGEEALVWTIGGGYWYVSKMSQSGTSNYKHTIFAPLTGGTVNTINNQYNIVNPAGSIATLTINLPSSPLNNDVVYIKFDQSVAAVTYSNGTTVGGMLAPPLGAIVVFTYDATTSTWY